MNSEPRVDLKAGKPMNARIETRDISPEVCPLCGKPITLNLDGRFRSHGSNNAHCAVNRWIAEMVRGERDIKPSFERWVRVEQRKAETP